MNLIQTSPIQKMDSQKIEQSIVNILSQNELCTMATVTLGGKPHANTAFYAFTDELMLYVLTPPDSRHGQNLTANSAISLAVYDSHQPWDNLKVGLQAFGTAKVAEGQNVALALDLYTKRFPGLGQWITNPSEIAKIDSRFYQISLDQIRLIDEPQFGQEVYIDIKVEA